MGDSFVGTDLGTRPSIPFVGTGVGTFRERVYHRHAIGMTSPYLFEITRAHKMRQAIKIHSNRHVIDMETRLLIEWSKVRVLLGEPLSHPEESWNVQNIFESQCF
jgi:hypothetical protein